MPGFTFTKAERLSGERAVDRLFAQGRGAFVWPFRYVVLTEAAPEPSVAVLISVPKRNHKTAVGRNLLKRRTREAWRLNKKSLADAASEKGLCIHLGLVYNAKDTVDYHAIEGAIQKILAAVVAGL